MLNLEINLDEVAGNGSVKNLSGKERGINARKHFKLDALDNKEGTVVVRVPDYLYAISSSFFLGLFSPSISRFGSRDKFLSHYQFSADSSMLDQINHGIDRALGNRGEFFGH